MDYVCNATANTSVKVEIKVCNSAGKRKTLQFQYLLLYFPFIKVCKLLYNVKQKETESTNTFFSKYNVEYNLCKFELTNVAATG